jgi:hypothetical protein
MGHARTRRLLPRLHHKVRNRPNLLQMQSRRLNNPMGNRLLMLQHHLLSRTAWMK